jgi:hypothetical protein
MVTEISGTHLWLQTSMCLKYVQGFEPVDVDEQTEEAKHMKKIYREEDWGVFSSK